MRMDKDNAGPAIVNLMYLSEQLLILYFLICLLYPVVV